jgi:hypothetical protein
MNIIKRIKNIIFKFKHNHHHRHLKSKEAEFDKKVRINNFHQLKIYDSFYI